MQLGELLNGCPALPDEWRDIKISGLTADSREVVPGYLFAGLAGTRADGARFVADARKRGAAVVLVSTEAPALNGLGIPVIRSGNPRRALALMAARFFGRQPHTMAAVTGTNGKTSVAAFLRQIWQRAGFEAASLGTVGVVTAKGTRDLHHTTPDPVVLHRTLRDLADEGITHAALEASSHGLAQHRVDGVHLAAGGFTNVTRDHLDYHASFEDYLAQKLRLFTEVLPEGATAVINADCEHAGQVIAAARARKLDIFTVGHAGEGLKLKSHRRMGLTQTLVIVTADGVEHKVDLPLVGDFQASNALVAAGLAIACGMDAAVAIAALAHLDGARGRLEKVGETREGAAIFVDYAHTPDALKTVLETLRPYTKRRLVIVFGAGGDRDKGKRPQMGAVCAKLADIAIVTDDNPRGEDPAQIRSEILAAASEAIEIGDRRTAIAAGVQMLRAGDVLLVAGKGHEAGQVVGDRVIPFTDHEAVAAAIQERRRRA